MDSEETEPRYFIDLRWYKENERSFSLLAQSRLCPVCRSRYSSPEVGPEVFAAFRDCCSKQENFFNPYLPLRELIFRLLLESGNEPSSTEKIAKRLKRYLLKTRDTRDISPPKLKRIIESDEYYGIRLFAEEPKNT